VDDKLSARARLIYERDNNSPLFLRTADFYLNQNNPQQALSILEKGMSVFPDHPLAFILKGKAHFMLGDSEVADTCFNKSGELLNSSRTYIHYKQQYKLPEKKVSPFDSSRGKVFTESLDKNQAPATEEVIQSKAVPADEKLSELAGNIINAGIGDDENYSGQASNQSQYSSDKSRLASETFAKIYLSQGEKEEAIKIYQLLIGRNPEKKEYYLQKIREIRSQ
jgi:tetratricopeptide (TPR) repeat protein